jgi:hypothetical protein
VLHLERDEVAALFARRNSPSRSALPSHSTWTGRRTARVIVAQAIEGPGEEFVHTFMLFSSMTTLLYHEIVPL